jgi:hypothetical protein
VVHLLVQRRQTLLHAVEHVVELLLDLAFAVEDGALAGGGVGLALLAAAFDLVRQFA